MRKNLTVLAVTIVATFAVASSLAPVADGVGANRSAPVPNRKAVHVQYLDNLTGYKVHSTVRITNTNLLESIRLSEGYVFGPGGRADVLSTHTGLPGTVIRPLETVELLIDDSIPGVTVGDFATESPVSTFMVDWVGDPHALRLTAQIVHFRPSSQDDRSATLEMGYDVRL